MVVTTLITGKIIDTMMANYADHSPLRKGLIQTSLVVLMPTVGSIGVVVDIALAAFATLATLLTLARKESIYTFACKQLGILAWPAYLFDGFIWLVLNKEQEQAAADTYMGFTHHFVAAFLDNQLDSYRAPSNNPFTRHILYRGMVVLRAVVSVISRLADVILVVPATVVALVCLGKSSRANEISIRTLAFPCLFIDLFVCTVKFMNPDDNSKLKNIFDKAP